MLFVVNKMLYFVSELVVIGRVMPDAADTGDHGSDSIHALSLI
jgi:hypothetical protein